MAVPGAHISCSVFISQTPKPLTIWKQLLDTTILPSLAAMFEYMKLQSRFLNVNLLKVTVRYDAMEEEEEEEYLVTPNDEPELRQIKRTIKEKGNAQLRRNKDNKINICLYIEPVGAKEIPPDNVAEEHDDQEFLDSLSRPYLRLMGLVPSKARFGNSSDA